MNIHVFGTYLIWLWRSTENAWSDLQWNPVTNHHVHTGPFECMIERIQPSHFTCRYATLDGDLETNAKSINVAEQNAKAELAGNIEAVIKRVTEQYTNQRSVETKKNFENKFEELSREVVRQDVKDVRVIGEKLYKQKDGIYSYWIAIESSKDNTLAYLKLRCDIYHM